MRREQSFFSPLSRWCFFSLDFPIRKTALNHIPSELLAEPGWYMRGYPKPDDDCGIYWISRNNQSSGIGFSEQSNVTLRGFLTV